MQGDRGHELDIFFVRHGETEGNRLKQYIGRTDLPLNERGREQIALLVEKLAMELGGKGFDRVFHSPSLRTRQTAEILLARHNVPLHSDPRLAELDFGAWDGKTYAEIEAADRELLWAWYDDPWSVTPPGGECLRDLDERLNAWVEHLLQNHRGETLLVVTHGGPLRWFLARYVERDPAKFAALQAPTGSAVRCQLSADGIWTIKGELR
jgi:alpha-ribazole phosphatase